MLNRLIKISLQNRFLVIIAASLLLIFGSITASNMEVDVFPDLTAPTVVVLTEAHGMAPEEVEKLVTFPLTLTVFWCIDNLFKLSMTGGTGGYFINICHH